MRIASDAGIAPRVHYIDEETGVVVMDWVAERPLATFPGGPLALARAVGAMVAQVQATTTFPEFVEYPEMVGRLWWWVCQTGLFAPGVLDPYTERLEDIRRSYAWDPAGSVSSHNDPVPRNILFDGTRLWLIDWESAYRNDPLVDVAIVLDNLAPSDQAKSTLIGAWLGRRLDPSTRTRLDQVSALARLYYAGVFLSASAAAFGPLSDRDVSAPTLREFHLAIANRDIAFGSPEAKHILGKMYLSSFMRGTAPPGLSVAI
jgi:aminoglycoside phosphotransferase (APT) family kinase protein